MTNRTQYPDADAKGTFPRGRGSHPSATKAGRCRTPAHGVRWGCVCLAIACWSGCAATPKPTFDEPDDVPMRLVIDRVNRNAEAMDFLLRAGGVEATAEFLRGDHRETFQLHGVLLYRRPRSLYLKLDHLGPAIEAGSNDEEFWFWERAGQGAYSWGRHDQMDYHADPDLPFRPDLLAEVLGLGGLPDHDESQDLMMWKGRDRYELLFQDRDATGQAFLAKAINVDRYPPFLVRSIVYFRPDGQPLVQAKLSDYQPIADSPALAPRHVRLDWLYDRGWMELEFGRVERFDNPAAESRFRSPRERGLPLGDHIRRLDRPGLPAPVAPPATLPDTTGEPE